MLIDSMTWSMQESSEEIDSPETSVIFYLSLFAESSELDG